jgi:NADH-quinone oxidoreductase subunit G
VIKLGAQLVPAAPGTEPEILDAIGGRDDAVSAAAEAIRGAGAVILVGERLAEVPGALTAALRLAEATGAALAWVPRRAGDRGAVEAGALPGLLPGGRPVEQAEARVDVAAAWGVGSLPDKPGRDTSAILAAASSGEIGGLVVGGLDPADLPNPLAALIALEKVGFVVSLEVRASAVTKLADVVLPVAPPAEKAGTFLDWEGRWRHFPQALAGNAMPDYRVLDALADELGVVLGLRGVERVRGEIAELEVWEGTRVAAPSTGIADLPTPTQGQAVLATWPLLLDAGRGQDGEPYLAGTAHRAVVRLSAATAAEIGATDAAQVTVSTTTGSITLPLVVTDMPDRVAWLPSNSRGSAVRSSLGAGAGSLVNVSSSPSSPAGAH